MDKETILKDLSARFGRKVLLSPEDIADVISQTPGAQAVARHRRSFDIPIIRRGRKVFVSVYDVADWLAGEGKITPTDTAPQEQVETPTPRRATNRPSLGKELMRRMLSTIRDEIDFREQLCICLERAVVTPSAKGSDGERSRTI